MCRAFQSVVIRGFPMTHRPDTRLLWAGVLGVALCAPASLWAQTEGSSEKEPTIVASEAGVTDEIAPPDQSLKRYRRGFEALAEANIGQTSRRIRFDWRRTSAHYGVVGAFPLELNNFSSRSASFLIRWPNETSILELGLGHQWVNGSPSTRRLSLTPYRQAGKPERFEVDLGFVYPLAEGIVTAWPSWMPATELVLNARMHFRYLVYPAAFRGLSFRDSLVSLVSSTLSDREISNLEEERLPAMDIDPARYTVLFGLGDDLYFNSGFFVGHRVLMNVPLVNIINASKLGFWFEFAFTMGFAL